MLYFKKSVFFLVLLNLVSLTPYAKQTNDFVNLPNPGLNFLHEATLIRPVPPEKKISFTVWLKLRNKAELDKLVEDVYDPHSPRYHQFLTPSLYEQQFAPSEEAVRSVEQFFSVQGMQTKRLNQSIRLRATAGQIEHALHVQINYYRYQNQIIHANTSPPQLPRELSQYVEEITGLDSISLYHSNEETVQPDSKEVQDLHFLWNAFIPFALPTDKSLQGFTGAQLQKTYNIKNIPPINGQRLDGKGQTLVIVDKCGTNKPAQILKDANQYFNANNIKPFVTSGPLRNFAMINSDGTPFTKCPNATSFSNEIALDVESSHTLAPGANTVLVLGTDQKTILTDVIHTLIKNKFSIAGFSNAYVISNSWSGQEFLDTSFEQTLKLAAAAGISVNFSSGDCGDNTYTTQKKCSGKWPSHPKVDYPSSSAYVTAVGATALFVDNNYHYAFETVWGTVKNIKGVYSYDGGTGGGISRYYGPVSWQSSISNFTAGGYGVISHYGNRRALPDIAMLGDPQTGLLIIADGVQVQDGGTSLACPLFSATLTLVNQARSLLNKGTPIGQAAPYLYPKKDILLASRAINLIIPPAVIISGATPPPSVSIHGTPAPASAFTLKNKTFGWDSSLTLEPEDQFWNDGVGIGSPNIPNFVPTMANM
ncbi:S53 family peptidase [Fluoribacter dumoffii]|uniref:Pseudomonalisin n=1 Tax=Fluoribacter dumoffii TaxID=463 RepID=A0A377G6Q7_9GAMM|nr:S53 family peptidase [Fluoribacter dumoffii]KTC89314.1 serine protease, subtilase family [Fluoribacter dumoffii NY 23]MCW8417569.1 S53 family peptidase [Fluoribacter dumoffii]MCW8454590.1 S53 family peptidase [Fluoribacter dumoffii]MCW8461334.1 S53 family peptidase [Fluoribacter dumoffii]MCW8484775.1 S53 family peptidase [Fluoribacter dumoffii]